MTYEDHKGVILPRFKGPGRCDNCRLYAWEREPHHLWARGRDNGKRLDIPTNLVSLCRICHGYAHGQPKALRSLFIDKVAAREGLGAVYIGRQMARLLRAPPNSEVRLCECCYGSGFMPKPSLKLCLVCGGGGVLDLSGAPWEEKPRRYSWQT